MKPFTLVVALIGAFVLSANAADTFKVDLFLSIQVAALYDIHGNLPALEAVLEEVVRARVEQVVVGGDVFPGPMPVKLSSGCLNSTSHSSSSPVMTN
jgi:hypothetical protein